MNSIVELTSSDGGNTWNKQKETPIVEAIYSQLELIPENLGEIPHSLVVSRNGNFEL